MKSVNKFRYVLILIILLLFNILNVNAETEEKNAGTVNMILENSFLVNDWETNSDDTSIEIKIPVIDVRMSDLMSNFSGSMVYMYGCSTSDKCTDENWDMNFSSSITFKLKLEDNMYYLVASKIKPYDIDSFKESKMIYYDIETSNKGFLFFKKSYKKDGSFLYKNNLNADEHENPKGSIANPVQVGINTRITTPSKKDDFWNNNMCYYFKINYGAKSSNDYVRFKITSTVDEPADHTLGNHIFYASDANSTLSKNIIEDDEVDSLYGISKDNLYAICDQYDVTYTFKYYDDNPLTVSENNYPKQQMIESQNGKNSYKTATDSEISAAKAAQNGKWNPETLCGEHNENCNIDITAFCINPYVSRTLKFLGILLTISKILIPAIIIILGFVDLVKIIVSGKVDEAKKQAVKIGQRIAIGIGIFLIPTILITIYNVAYNIANDSTEVSDGNLIVPENFKNCVGCILDATNDEACIINTSDSQSE